MSVKYRCSECGSPKSYREDFLEGEGYAPLRCREHPVADVLTWTADYQGACLWIEQEIRQGGKTIEQLRSETRLDQDYQNASGAVILGALVLMERWGGCLPERRVPATNEKPSPAGLYG